MSLTAHLGEIFLAASVLAVAINGAAWRLMRSAEAEAAFGISALFLAQEAIGLWLLGAIPRPWSWVTAGPMDLMLLIITFHLAKRERWRWAQMLAVLLFAGLVLQAWLWTAWFPHRQEPYNREQWSIFMAYWEASCVLAAGELGCALWPGILDIVRAGARALGIVGRLRLGRRMGLRSISDAPEGPGA